MVSTRLKISLLAAAGALAATVAQAADYQQPPPVYYQPPPPPVEHFANDWYLRGYVGVGMNGNADLEYLPAAANAGNGFEFQHNSISDATFVGGAIGYEFNNWLRVDISAEYRGRARLYAFGDYPPNGLDIYEGYLKSYIFLANAFVDLGTWECFTPFVGVGIGGAYNNLVDFTDFNPNGGYGFGRNPSEWNLAWAVYAGVAYNVTKNLKIELAYRYLNYGEITDTVDCSVNCEPDSFRFSKLHSHDFMLGLRWTCCDTAPPPPPRYVYTPPPPPVYVPPPLPSRG
jgi:opacity protein-like surface antigen